MPAWPDRVDRLSVHASERPYPLSRLGRARATSAEEARGGLRPSRKALHVLSSAPGPGGHQRSRPPPPLSCSPPPVLRSPTTSRTTSWSAGTTASSPAAAPRSPTGSRSMVLTARAAATPHATSPTTVTLSVPADVSASRVTFVFTSCNNQDLETVTFSSAKVGNYPITVKQISDSGPGTFLNIADFTLKVSAPAPTNTKPSVTVDRSGRRRHLRDRPASQLRPARSATPRTAPRPSLLS